MTFDKRTKRLEIDQCGVVDKEHRMRIAHAGRGEMRRRAGDRRIERDLARILNGARKRYLAPIQPRTAHVDRDKPCRPDVASR